MLMLQDKNCSRAASSNSKVIRRFDIAPYFVLLMHIFAISIMWLIILRLLDMVGGFVLEIPNKIF